MIGSMDELEALAREGGDEGRAGAATIDAFDRRYRHGLKCRLRNVNTCRRCLVDYERVVAAVHRCGELARRVSMDWALKESAYIIN